MKKKLMEMLSKKEARKSGLGKKANETESIEELRNINADLETLNAEIAELRSMIDALPDDSEEGNPEEGGSSNQEERGDNLESPEQRNQPKGGVHRILGSYGNAAEQGEGRTAETDAEWEERGDNLMNKRAVTVSNGNLVLPKHTSSNIKGTFNQVSTLVDRVNTVPLDGGESYETPYEISHGEGNYTEEGDSYFDVDQEFGYAAINKTKVTAYNEITEEVLKLPKANYAQRTVEGVRKSLRKKLTREILTGSGAAGEFVGIFSSNATAINPNTDIEITDIDADTLDTIIYSFGGDEDVEDASVLILSKDDLRKFAMVKHPDGRKVYDIVNNGNTGTIDGVEFIINSNAGSSETATAGDYLIAYGPLSNYEMAVFSGTEIKRSEDVKFKEGMIAHRGSVFAGGNVVAQNGFLRVKKGEVTPEA